jgi:hypothetical protein
MTTAKKTSSLWGKPPKRYYKFLKHVEQEFARRRLKVAILGCSDGKFALPAARRGHSVLAIDIDGVALYGGNKTGPSGEVYMPGLVARLRTEGLESQVQVIHDDFVNYSPPTRYHAVFTSGAIQYSCNLKHSMLLMIEGVLSYVANSGFIYIDYMLPMEEKYRGRDNYPGREEWQNFFPENSWEVIYNRVLPPVFEQAHVDNPVDHYHHWGHLFARRK